MASAARAHNGLAPCRCEDVPYGVTDDLLVLANGFDRAREWRSLVLSDIARLLGGREAVCMGRASVEMYLCAFYLGKWEPEESVEDAYHRALNVTDDQFRSMQRDDDGALQQRHADAIDRMYEVAGLNLKTATEAAKASLRLLLERIPVMCVNRRSQRGSENSCILRD